MVPTPESYEAVAEAFDDTESLTVLIAAGATRAQVADALGIDLTAPVEDGWAEDGVTGWALLEVPGGVLAAETTGFGDPANADLAALSGYGPAAVVRCNILGHYRFGCARDGALVFDDDEYIYLEDPATFPPELRPLFDLVHDDLEDDEADEEPEERASPVTVGLAMAEQVTGVTVTVDQVEELLETGFFAAPSSRYPTASADKPSSSNPRSLEGDEADADEAEEEEEDGGGGPRPGESYRPGQIIARDGLYAITLPGRPPQHAPHPPDDPKARAFCHSDDGGRTTWIRKLDVDPRVRVKVTFSVSDQEPGELLRDVGPAYPMQAEAMVVSEHGLMVVDDSGPVWHLELTEDEGLFHLRAFARTRPGDRWLEDHFVALWPARF